MQWPRHFAALSSRNYRLYFAGQIVSLIGTWMTQTASLWLAYHLTSSPLMLGLVGFASMAPIFFLAPFAGVWVDRVNRHRLLIGTQVLSLLQSLALAVFALTNTMTITHLLSLCLLQGFIGAFDMPVRQALVVEFVETKDHLGNAIALNSSLFNLARLIGPAIGGFVVAGFGVGFCFLFDAASYLAVIAALFAMRMRPASARPRERHPLVEMREGFSYVFGFIPVRALILLVAAMSAVGFSFSVLTPIFARDVFGGDARTLGWLMAASGTGAVLGALYLGGRKTVRGLGNVIAIGGSLMGLALIGFGISRSLPLSLGCLMFAGMGGVLLMASSNTLVQTMVPDDKRGRVMSIFTMAFSGTAPLGNLLAGAVAARIGATPTLIAGGAICLGVVSTFYLHLPGLRAAAAPVLAAVEAESFEPTVFPTKAEKDT